MKQYLLLLLFILGLAAPAWSQFTPQGFSYQSIVRDNNGNALTNQTLTLLFSIRSGAPNGPVAYTEKQVASTNEFGLVNLTIGQGGTVLQGTFGGVNWGGGAKYLTVAVESSPNVFDELGSTQLMSVPYALYAETAANGGGGGGSDNWGNQSAQTNATLSGNGTPANPLAIAQQNAEPGQVLKWNGNAWLPSSDLLASGTNGGTVTQVSTGTGLSGGPITTSGTVSLANTGVTPGPYGSATQIPVLTIDAQGRVTNAFTTVVQPGTIGLNGATGISVQQNGLNFTVTNTGDTNAGDDVNLNTPFGGDVSGIYNDLQLKTGVVGSPEITDGAVTAADLAAGAVTSIKLATNAVTGPKIDNMGATNGQVLKWNGTTWAPAADNGGSTYTAGSGISITGTAPNFTIANTGDSNAADDLTTTSTANGDVSGPFSNLQIKADAVGVTEIANNAVNTAELVNGAVTSAKIDDMNAAIGQVLKWNGNAWQPAEDLEGTTGGTVDILAGAGINVSVSGTTFTIVNSGDTNANNDITIASMAGGDISGTFDNLQIKANTVSTPELANGSVTGVKINAMSAATGQVLKYNGTTWAPANDETGGVTGLTVNTNATLTGAGTLISPLGIAPQGATSGQVLKYNGSTWLPAADETGTAGTSVTTNATLTGAGTVASPLGIATQGATNGQFLRFNGTTWLPGTAPGGDDWGAQTVEVGAAFIGDGTTAAPLNLGQQSAAIGDVLKWNGLAWKPAPDDNTGTGVQNTYAAGTGISITGTAPNFTITNTGDADKSPTNELQTITLAGNQLSLSNGGGTVTLPASGDNTYTAGAGINFTGTAPNQTIVNTGDLSATNELQTISLAGNQLTLSNSGGTVTLPASNTYTAGAGITITGTAPNQVIANNGDLSNTNELQNLTLNGSLLTISGTNSTVDFDPILTTTVNNAALWRKVGTHISNLNPDNVLIGTNVNGSGKLQVTNESSQEAGYFVSTDAANTSAVLFAKHAGEGPAAYLTSAAGPALITQEGNVGINTPTPTYRVDVTGDGRFLTAGGTPQLTLETSTGELAQLVLKNSSTVSWNVNSKSGGADADFNIDLIKTPAAVRFLNIKNTGLITLGNTLAGSSTKILHGTRGLILQNNVNNHNWEFFVNNPAGNLELYNDQFSTTVAAGTFATNGVYLPSDKRLKKDIVDLPKGILGKVMQLRPVSYHYQSEDAASQRSMGFLAQDVQALFPELVGQTTARNAEHTQYLSVNYTGFSVVTIQAMQEQQIEIERLAKENDTLRQQVESLETRLQRLERAGAPHKD